MYFCTDVQKFLSVGAETSVMAKKRKGVFIDDDSWRDLKVHCTKNDLNVVDKGGAIIEEWVAANCTTGGPTT
jgi:hypothetical protein